MVSSTANVSSLLVRLETGSESCKLPIPQMSSTLSVEMSRSAKNSSYSFFL